MADEPEDVTWTLDDGTLVRSYRPSNGTEGEVFYRDLCARCMCEPRPDKAEDHDGCPILADTMAYNITDPDYPPQFVEAVEPPHAHTCTAFHVRPIGWDGIPSDPGAEAVTQARYDALPRDPATGRPVIP